MKSEYGVFDRLLHRIVLGSGVLGEALYDMEKSLYLKRARQTKLGSSIFVCGLARSGTTILMRSLHQTNLFASVTYNDMPFVLAPNLWRKIRAGSNRSENFTERAHGDRIEVSYKSPEALDEIFWRTLDDTNFVTEKGLYSYEPKLSVLEEFETFKSIICHKYDKNRYLSKNNNNIFRLKTLAKFASDDIFLIPFRNPATHAQSLLNQHKRFMNVDGFQATYMRWLGHFEFGVNQKDYLFDHETTYESDKLTLDYWLDVWTKTYSTVAAIVEESGPNLVPICYEKLCSGDLGYTEKLGKLCSIPQYSPEFDASETKPTATLSASKLTKANQVYERLCSQDLDKIFATEK